MSRFVLDRHDEVRSYRSRVCFGPCVLRVPFVLFSELEFSPCPLVVLPTHRSAPLRPKVSKTTPPTPHILHCNPSSKKQKSFILLFVYSILQYSNY
eukprot:scaffold16449_cov51-Attheya_sp.AAC.4